MRRYATVPLVRPDRITIVEVAPRDGAEQSGKEGRILLPLGPQDDRLVADVRQQQLGSRKHR